MTVSKPLAFGAGVIVVALVLWFALGSKSDSDSSVAANGAPPTLLIVTPDSGSTFNKPTATVSGTATPGAIIQFSSIGTVAADASGAWTSEIPLGPGRNDLTVTAKKDNLTSQPEELVLTRKLTRTELKEKAAAIARAEAARKNLSAYRRSAKDIPYAELSADPEKFIGQRVFIRGNIFQIREDQHHSYLLVEVLESDSEKAKGVVWVNYGEPKALELYETVHIYGEVIGQRQYESPDSDQKFVPEVNAKYVTESP